MGKDVATTVPESGSVYVTDSIRGSLTFGVRIDEHNPNFPTEGFASITEAVDDIHRGKMVVVISDEMGENDGCLALATSQITPEAIDFLVKHRAGIIYVAINGGYLDRLQLPHMNVKHGAKGGVSVSASEIATTIRALTSRDSNHEEFMLPGNVFLINYRGGGVLERAGDAEAAVDLALLAGLEPATVFCKLVHGDGLMARFTKLREFAIKENLKIISIAALIRHRRMNTKLVELCATGRIPTKWGSFTAHCYESLLDGLERVAMVKGASQGTFRVSNRRYIWLG